MSKKIAYSKYIVLTIAALLLTMTAIAQSTTAGIAGQIRDSKSPVAEALVTAVSNATGASYYTFSDKQGRYRLNGLVADSYSMKVDASGYHTQTVGGIQTVVGEATIVDVELKLASTNLEEVVITGEADNSPMNIHHAGTRTNISHEAIKKMPNATHSINDVMRLTPQAAVMGSGLAAGGGNYRSSSITVDGATFNNVFGSGSNLPAGGNPIALEAIDQITINLTPFDVRYSGFVGSAINIATKHGGNQWHASIYDYFTNNNLRGDMVGDNEIANSRAINNVIGRTISGPIVKDKLFFFVNAEYTVDNVAGSSREARANAGSAWGSSTTFNRPTVGEMDNISRFLQNNYGYDPGRYQGYSLSTPDYKVLARIDWNINKNNHFHIRFNHTHTDGLMAPSSSMSPLGGTNTTVNIDGTDYTFNRYAEGRESDYAMYYESARYYQELNFTSLSAELNSALFDGRGTNLARLTWSYQNEPRSTVGDIFPTVDILEPYTNASGDTSYALFTTFGIDPFTYENLRRVHTLNATDEVSLSVGMHSLVAGAQMEFNRIVNGYMQGGAGWYIYDSWNSFATGKDPLSFMITHANMDDPSATVYPTFDYSQASLYLQDAIDVSNYLKLTAGVRLEMPFISFVNDNENKDFLAVAEANPNSSFAGLSTADMPNSRVNVSPRIGFNWDVAKDRSLIVRGGTGLYTGRIPNTWLISAVSNSNCLQYQYIANLQTGNPVMPFFGNRDDIIAHLYADNPFQQQDLAAPTATTIMAKDLTMPSIWKSSIAVDAKLPFGIKGSLEGIYSYSSNEVVASTLGYRSGDSILLPGEPELRQTYYSEGISNKNGGKMSGYYLHNAKELHGQYISLTAQLSRHFDCGLELMAAYTHNFSVAVSEGGGDQVNNIAQVCNVNGDNSPELGYTAHVSPNRVIANAVYTLQQDSRSATRIGIFYEGYNSCYVNANFNQSRYSYTMTTDAATHSRISAAQLIYIPTAEELAEMPFVSDENREAYETFISGDAYLSQHRGEYSKRNGAVSPWLNRVNLNINKEYYMTMGKHAATLEIGADVNNVANLLYSKWGVTKKLSGENILDYKNGAYTFIQPQWTEFNNFVSTWNILLHVRYSF